MNQRRLKNLEYAAYLRRIERADERTRTAHLLITSDNSDVAGVCSGLPFPHFQAVFSAPGCRVLHSIALPVVSEYCQYHPSPVLSGGCRLPKARRTRTSLAQRSCIGSSSSGPPSRRLTTRTPRRALFSQ